MGRRAGKDVYRSCRTGTIWCTVLLLGLLVSMVGAWHGGLSLNVAVEAL